MRSRTARWMAGLLLALLALPAWAAVDLNHLRGLVDAGKSAQAYEYARRYLREAQGGPRFDLYYGIAAIDSGHASEGVLALERVLKRQPDNHLARLELARGYFLLEEYPRSRQEFERVLASNPPDPVKANINRYLDAIRLKEGIYYTTATFYVDAGGGYDTNANSGPTDSLIDTRLGTTTLSAESTEQDDTFLSLGLGTQFNSPLTPAWSIYGNLDLTTRQYSQQDEFSYLTIDGRFGLSWRTGRQLYRAGAYAQSYILDGKRYREIAALNANWRYQTDKKTLVEAYGQYGSLSYPDNGVNDATMRSLGVGLARNLSARWSPMLFGSLAFGHDSPDESGQTAKAETERDYYWLRAGVQVSPTDQLALTGALIWQASEYGAEDPVFGTTRQDDYLGADLSLNWLASRHWSARLGAVYSNNDSTIAIYDYSRTQVFASLRYSY